MQTGEISMTDERLNYRVVYIGTGRQPKKGGLRWLGGYEPERDWRIRLAQEMEDACQEMARRGLRLAKVVPALSSSTWNWNGSWTEGVWLYFESDRAPAE
jgi:hypothetical protein